MCLVLPSVLRVEQVVQVQSRTSYYGKGRMSRLGAVLTPLSPFARRLPPAACRQLATIFP
jgi:hypothetical protein